MFTFTLDGILVAYGIFLMFYLLGKMAHTGGNTSHCAPRTNNNQSANPNNEYKKLITLVSPHNTASDITWDNGAYNVTIENSVTGDKEIVRHKNRRHLCWLADEVAAKLAIKERNEYQTV